MNVLLGENGIITMAQKAKKEYENSVKREQQQLASFFERNYATYNGELHVDGINLMNEHNGEIQLKGVNLGGRDYLQLYDKTSIENLKKAGVNCIRIGLGTSYYTEETYISHMKNIIDICIELDLYVDLVFWNNGNPNNNLFEAQQYFDYWVENYKKSNNVIYEICNEASEGVAWNDIKEYSNSVITRIRAINQNAVIIVGTPYYDSAITEIIGNELEFTNIMYAIHRYPAKAEATNITTLKDLNTAYYNSIPLIVTEWSIGNNTGEIINIEEANKLAKIMKEHQISWIYYTMDPSGTYSFDILKEYTNTLEEEKLTESGKYFLKALKDEFNEKETDEDYMLAERSSMDFEEIKDSIVKVEFTNKIAIPDGARMIRDASKYGTGNVVSYVEKDNDLGTDKLVIAADNNYVYAPENSRNLFGSFTNLSNIDFTYFSTKYSKNIEVMFYKTALTKLDLSVLDLSNVEDISELVRACSKLENLNISNINFEKIKDTTALFDKCKNGINIYVKDVTAANKVLYELKTVEITGNIYYKNEDTWKEYLEKN